MGNTTCSCTYRRRRSEPDKRNHSNGKVGITEPPKSATPYENGSLPLLIVGETYPTEIHDSESDDAIEKPEIATKFSSQQETQQNNLYPEVCYRSNLTSNSDSQRTTSLFSTEEVGDCVTPPSNVPMDIYDLILRDFLVTHYPINDRIICDMVARHLLLHPDARTIIHHRTDQTKSLAFFDNFVFSEVNICKLATFLHVLLTENSTTLREFHQPIQYYRSIVDLIYYVVNVASLLAEFSNEDAGKCLSSMINVNSAKSVKLLRNPIDEGFFIKIVINSIFFPSRFWTNFSSINDQFRCCQELTLSSCDLGPEEVFHVCRGVLNSGIIRILDVSTNPMTDEGLQYVQELFSVNNSLVALNLACCSVTAGGMERFLDVIAHNTPRCRLKHLNISHNDLRDLTDPYLQILARVSLSVLEIKSINLRQQRSLFQSLKLNHSLRRVDLSGNQLLSNDITFLAAGLAYNSSLRTISLATMGLVAVDCTLLNNTLLMNKSLVSIDLSDNLIGDDGVDFLKDIVTMKRTLIDLYLKRCGISLQGILILLGRVSNSDSNLKLLDLCYNRSSDTDVLANQTDIVRRIRELSNHIILVKDVKIKLWGTIDDVSE